VLLFYPAAEEDKTVLRVGLPVHSITTSIPILSYPYPTQTRPSSNNPPSLILCFFFSPSSKITHSLLLCFLFSPSSNNHLLCFSFSPQPRATRPSRSRRPAPLVRAVAATHISRYSRRWIPVSLITADLFRSVVRSPVMHLEDVGSTSGSVTFPPPGFDTLLL